MKKYSVSELPVIRNQKKLNVEIKAGAEGIAELESVGQDFESYGIEENEYILLPANEDEVYTMSKDLREGSNRKQKLILVETADNANMNNSRPRWISANLLIRKDFNRQPIDAVSKTNITDNGCKDAMSALRASFGRTIKGLARSTYSTQKFTEAGRPVPGETTDQNFTPLAWA